MEKLTFKSKFTQYLSLASIVGAATLTVIGLIDSLIMMFMELGNGSLPILTYISLGFIAVAVIALLIILGIFLRTIKKGIKQNTFKILDTTRIVVSGVLVVYAILLFVNNSIVQVLGEESSFFKVASIATFAIELVALLYRIWRVSWMKENPDRIYNTYVLKEPDGYGEESGANEISQSEVKQIETRK